MSEPITPGLCAPANSLVERLTNSTSVAHALVDDIGAILHQIEALL